MILQVPLQLDVSLFSFPEGKNTYLESYSGNGMEKSSILFGFLGYNQPLRLVFCTSGILSSKFQHPNLLLNESLPWAHQAAVPFEQRSKTLMTFHSDQFLGILIMASLNSLPNWVVFPSPHSTAKNKGEMTFHYLCWLISRILISWLQKKSLPNRVLFHPLYIKRLYRGPSGRCSWCKFSVSRLLKCSLSWCWWK